MSTKGYFSPRIVLRNDESSQILDGEEWIVIPFDLDVNMDLTGPKFLFGFPPDCCILIQGYKIKTEIFDYYNPLILTKELLNIVTFWQDLTELKNLSLFEIKSNHLNRIGPTLKSRTVYYPNNWTINAEKLFAVKSYKGGTQFYQLIDQKPADPPSNSNLLLNLLNNLASYNWEDPE